MSKTSCAARCSRGSGQGVLRAPAEGEGGMAHRENLSRTRTHTHARTPSAMSARRAPRPSAAPPPPTTASRTCCALARRTGSRRVQTAASRHTLKGRRCLAASFARTAMRRRSARRTSSRAGAGLVMRAGSSNRLTAARRLGSLSFKRCSIASCARTMRISGRTRSVSGTSPFKRTRSSERCARSTAPPTCKWRRSRVPTIAYRRRATATSPFLGLMINYARFGTRSVCRGAPGPLQL